MSDRVQTAAEIEANVKKIEAEARKFDAEAQHFDLMTKHAAELVRTAREQAQQSKIETRISQLQLARQEREETHLLATNFNNRQVVFDGDVNFKNVRFIIENLTLWHREHPGEDLNFVITTWGGEMSSGFQLVDFLLDLRRQGHNVTTVALGAAMSMGAVLLQAGDTRAMGRHAMMLIHEGSFGAVGTPGQVEDMVDFGQKLREKAFELMASRAATINPKTTVKFLKAKAARRDWFLTAEEALELGLIDEIH